MQNNDSQQIVALISKVFNRRKRLVLFSIVGILIPIVFYNQTATPTYQASTSLIFEELTNPIANYSYDLSREILIQNRLEEIKSLAFSEDIVKALPVETYDNYPVPEDAGPDFDRFGYLSQKINRSVNAVSIRGSNIIQIVVESDDPALCRDLANTAAQVFQDRMYKVKHEGVRGVRSFIEEQLTRAKRQLNRTEEELRQFKEHNKIISIDKESQGLLRRRTEAEVLYNSVRSSRESVQERLKTIEKKLHLQKQDLVPSITDIATPYTQKLKEKLIMLQGQFTDLRLQGYGLEHPKMTQLQNEISETKKNLTSEALKVAKSENIIDPITQIEKSVNDSYTLQVELEALKAQEAALRRTIDDYETKLATLPEKEYVLARLTREKEVTEQNYMMLLKKHEEARISEAEKLASIRIIDTARKPEEPIAPRKKVNFAIGLVLGLLVGFGLAFIKEVSHNSLDSTEELERVTGWHVLAAIPVIENSTGSKMGLHSRATNGSSKSPMIKRSLITGSNPKTGIAETYRMLRTNLQFLGLGQKFKTILVTSVGPDEGKSTTMTNLGITLAKMEQKVLIVDSDLRKPQLHALFDLDKEPGLSDLLVYHSAMKEDFSPMENESPLLGDGFKGQELGDLVDNFSDFVMNDNFLSKIKNLPGLSNLNILNSSLIEAVQSTHVENLKVLTSGKQLKNPSETIATVSLKALLDELKNKFNVVLIDSAPLLLVPETMMISSLVDGVIFVVDSQRYNQEMLMKAKNLLQKANANVIGAVLNNIEINNREKNNYYYYEA
ncbi:MAG: GumC family protein [bacterium]